MDGKRVCQALRCIIAKINMSNLNIKNQFAFFVCCLFLITSCQYHKKIEQLEVDAIYWHEKQKYSAAIIIDNQIILKNITYGCGWNNPVKIYHDVPQNKKSWYKCEWLYNKSMGRKNTQCEIHIHGLNSIKTAGWDHGKFGSGLTIRID